VGWRIHGIRWKGSGMVNGRKGVENWKRDVREEMTKGDKK